MSTEYLITIVEEYYGLTGILPESILGSHKDKCNLVSEIHLFNIGKRKYYVKYHK